MPGAGSATRRSVSCVVCGRQEGSGDEGKVVVWTAGTAHLDDSLRSELGISVERKVTAVRQTCLWEGH